MKTTLLIALPLLFPLAAHAQVWNNPASDTFATSIVRGDDGDWWAGADDQGVLHVDAGGNWRQFAGPKELGDSHVTCIAVDAAKRVWVGTASAGVAVFDGTKWTRYTVWNGPLSNRINALKADASGAVWGATDAGVFRWSQKDGWQYPDIFSDETATRDAARKPAYALTVESPTSVLVATDDGLNRLALAGGEYKLTPIGRAESVLQPSQAQGTGFLPGPVHDVTIDSTNQIWCATMWGVCVSKDKGATWQFLRGADWNANVKGSPVPLDADETTPKVDPLSEDWVTTLAPAANGKMWLGFRQKGAEERDCRTLELLVSTRDDAKFASNPAFGGDWITGIVPLDGDSAAFARYGGGLASIFGGKLPPADQAFAAQGVALPETGAPPAAFVEGLAAQLEKRPSLQPGEGAFYNLDRETRGDWPLRYGNEAGGLEGTYDDKSRFAPDEFWWSVTTGPHRIGKDADCYITISESESQNPNVVQLPWRDIRRQSEVNDGTWQGRKYPLSFEGPDLWTTMRVPAGVHRVSFYWYNKDAHSGNNRMRDHSLRLYPGTIAEADCFSRKPLATARLWSGWNGEYASFVVRGPARYRVRMARDRSNGTILQGVFFDRLGAPQTKPAWLPDRLQMPDAPAPDAGTPRTASQKLWAACDEAESRGVPCPIERIVALRAAKSEGASDQTLAPWRIQAGLWDESGADRQAVALPNAKE